MCNARSTKTTPSSSSSSEPVKNTTTANCAPEPIEIDIATLSTKDLESLKQDDPFLYYSIPAVRRAAFSLEEPDMLSPTSLKESLRGSTTVKRRTRVSYECHMDLLMDDLLGDFEEECYESALQQMDHDLSQLLDLFLFADSNSKKTRNGNVAM